MREPRKVKRMATRLHQVAESDFADDTAIMSDDWDEFQLLATEMATCLRDRGCDLNLLKTEWLEVPSFASGRDRAPLPGSRILRIGGQEVAKCGAFRYLGSVISCDIDGGSSLDVGRRCSLAHAAFSKLRHVWNSTVVSLATVLLYGSETWSLGHAQSRKLHNTWMSCVRRALGVRQPVRQMRICFVALVFLVYTPCLRSAWAAGLAMSLAWSLLGFLMDFRLALCQVEFFHPLSAFVVPTSIFEAGCMVLALGLGST